MKLTDTFVKRKQGNGNVQKHSDGGGLFLYITPTGKKSWRLAYRFAGKQKLLVIGPYPAISLKEARERRDAAKKLLVDNIDPSAAKQAAKVAAANAARDSFETVAREWVERNAAKWSDAYRLNIIDRLERDIFGTLGKRPIKTITAPELLAVLRKIEERGAVETAHRGLSDCGRIFRYAIVTGRAERDVAADLRGALTRPQETHFATMTDPKDIGKILRDIDEYNGLVSVRYVLKLIPYFFVRSSELAKAEWAEFDLDKAEWRIPAERMKMRRIHIVPIARQPMEILRELHTFSGQGQYLFPGKGKLSPSVDGKSLIWALRRKMGYSKDVMSIHGFRAMASTYLNEQGYNRDWIERQLAHSERDSIRAAYNYAEYLPERRKMMQDYADYLTALKEQQ
ncbi:integrase arm-type DNA-binding domain-containing protein [Desulfovibrio sp. OttesenSCG-928-I05]|nr:integrase arm-type DNA-binding domain-containing protein [Desulfovibrio sp. OttesenSCG-928-I05]